jgi:hypothetical protein
MNEVYQIQLPKLKLLKKLFSIPSILGQGIKMIFNSLHTILKANFLASSLERIMTEPIVRRGMAIFQVAYWLS